MKSAREIMAIEQNLKQNMKTMNRIRPLRVGATVTVGANIIGKIIAQITEEYPDIDVFVNVSNTHQIEHMLLNNELDIAISNTHQIEHMLLNNELDIAIAEGIMTHNELNAKPVFVDKLCIICGKDHPFAGRPYLHVSDLHNQNFILRERGSGTRAISKPVFVDKLCIICGKDHPFAGRPYLHVSDLHNQNFILRERGSGTRAIFEAAMDAHHVPYEIKWESSSTPAILDAVSRNLGLGFVSERCATGKADAGLLFQCPVPEIDSERFFYLCYNSTHPVSRNLGLGFVSERCATGKADAGLLFQCPVPEIDSERFFYLCYNSTHPMTSQMKDFSDYICSLPKDFN